MQYRRAAYEQSLFSEDFENGIPSTWTTIDADGDGNNWFALSEIGTIYPFYATLDLADWAHEGNNSALSASAYNNPEDEGGGYTPLESENWLITPQVELPCPDRFDSH